MPNILLVHMPLKQTFGFFSLFVLVGQI